MPRFISRKENLAIPIIGMLWMECGFGSLAHHMIVIGSMTLAQQAILVDRDDPDSKRKAVEAIVEHGNKNPKEGWNRLLVFPEGIVL